MAFHYHLLAPLDHIDRESHDRACRANKSIRCWEKCQTAPMWRRSNSTIYSLACQADLMRHSPNGRWVVRYCQCPGRLHWLEESERKKRVMSRRWNEWMKIYVLKQQEEENRGRIVDCVTKGDWGLLVRTSITSTAPTIDRMKLYCSKCGVVWSEKIEKFFLIFKELFQC